MLFRGLRETAKGCGVSFEHDEKMLSLAVVTVAHSEYTKTTELYTLNQ